LNVLVATVQRGWLDAADSDGGGAEGDASSEAVAEGEALVLLVAPQPARSAPSATSEKLTRRRLG
jgi:hypothetical protein